jgi:hypothetical protein
MISRSMRLDNILFTRKYFCIYDKSGRKTCPHGISLKGFFFWQVLFFQLMVFKVSTNCSTVRFLHNSEATVLPKSLYVIIQPAVSAQKIASWDSRWEEEYEFYKYGNPFVKRFCQHSKYSTLFFVQ